ncbi:MAG TPA: protein-disulfide reductase DsbD N-terminal domain-containing protein, partial [Chlorobaculum sp.]|nr:protein-disulfide reductase DsbD N-terminal domain-containing protein [Chlorobaculum sp.]
MTHSTLRKAVAVIGVFLSICVSSVSGFAGEFLDPEQAFKVSAELTGKRSIALHWQIAKGYKLYRDQVRVSIESGDAKLKDPSMPAGITIVDPSSNEKVVIYHDHLAVDVPVEKASAPFRFRVEYQGCAEDGLCYAPMNRVFKVDPVKPGALVAEGGADGGSSGLQASVPAPASNVAAAPAPVKEKNGGDDMSLAKSTLEGGSLWKI